MNKDDMKDNTYGVSIIYKIIFLCISILGFPTFLYVLIRGILEIDTFGNQKYLIIAPIIGLFLDIYCILVTIKCKIIYYDKIIIYKYVILSETIELSKYKYFKIDSTIPISYLLFTENKKTKKRIHYFFTKRESFRNFLLNNLEEMNI
ncbi:MAG: hypothetical protein LBC52_03780 [Treponema sp.]|jgi:hypothetical protein|nr:hypothetical protein [Treponema sp.]